MKLYHNGSLTPTLIMMESGLLSKSLLGDVDTQQQAQPLGYVRFRSKEKCKKIAWHRIYSDLQMHGNAFIDYCYPTTYGPMDWLNN